MEVVNVFNKELKSMLECKLPVSRHKMSLITKSAMKALKFYKHVVQSVEKFIVRCSREYKVPGLYVIDAIVRQSKHQYCDKDVFVPRFTRNIVSTFLHLSQCESKDRGSIERVLRLWQQNGVFPTDLVEALLELVSISNTDSASTNSSVERRKKVLQAGEIVVRLVNEWNLLKGKPEEKIDVFLPHMEESIVNNNNEVESEVKAEGGLIDSITKLLTRFQAETGQDVTLEINQIQILHQKIVEQSALLAQGEMIDSDTLSQLHQSMEELTKKAAKAAAVQQSKLAMLASDDKDHMNEASTDLEFVEQLQQMVDTLGQTRALQEELKQALESKQIVINKGEESEQLPIVETSLNVIDVDKDFRELEEGEEEPGVVDEAIDEAGAVGEDLDLRMLQNNSNNTINYNSDRDSVNNLSYDKISRSSSVNSRKRRCSTPPPSLLFSDTSQLSKRHRSRSKEQQQRRKSTHRKSREENFAATEELLESQSKRKRHLPPLRPQYVSVLSHTLFIGHLHKHMSESKLRSLCEQFGTISEFHMIPPRGCAFVTFDKRKSAYKARMKMNEMKFEGRELKVAWAPNKGVKDEKELLVGEDRWSVEHGCTYVAMEQFPINRSAELTEGCAELDEESLTEELKQAIYQFEQQKSEAVARGLEPSSMETIISVAAEVGSKIPLLSPNINNNENIIDTSATPPFFSQFTAPPPMMMPPPMLSFPPPPPPPHIFMPTVSQSSMLPTLQLNNNNNINHNNNNQGGAMIIDNNNVSSSSSSPPTAAVVVDTVARPPLIMSQPPAMLSDNHRVMPLHRHPPPFIITSHNNSNSYIPPGPRYIRPPLRYTRLPPPGFPAYRPNIMNNRPRF